MAGTEVMFGGYAPAAAGSGGIVSTIEDARVEILSNSQSGPLIYSRA